MPPAALSPEPSSQPPPKSRQAENPIDQDGDEDDEDDPIVESYTVLLKPELPAHQQLLVLQHPNRTTDYLSGATELRLKPNSGMVELDVPLGHANAYDKAKGVTWGKALSQSMAAKAGGTHGLAGGFGIGAPPVRVAGGRSAGGSLGGGDDGIEVVHGSVSAADFSEAVRRDKVLRTQVLGGQIATGDGQTRYMVGVFSGENVHLTPITSLAHLRPQLHHIDAKVDLERAVRRARDAEGVAASGGQAGGGGAAGGGPARAIHMTVKSAEQSDKQMMESMADRLRAVQTEPWRRMAYVDETTDDAWALYEESLVHRGLDASAPSAAKDDAKDKGKLKEGVEADDQQMRLVDRVAALGTKWGEEDLLHVVSGRERPKEKIRQAVAKPGSKAPAGSSRSNAMDVD